jgi:cold-inducible RNA-binding protein
MSTTSAATDTISTVEDDIEVSEVTIANQTTLTEFEVNASTSSNLFVGDLSVDITEETLKELFSEFGTVMDVTLKRSKNNGSSLGYGFVKMANHEEAQIIHDKFNGKILHNRAMRIGWARRNSSCLFLENLDPEITIEELNKAFAIYGELDLSRTSIVKNGATSLAVLHYTLRDSALSAKNNMNGKILGNLPVYVEWGQLPSYSTNGQHNYYSNRYSNSAGNYSTSSRNDNPAMMHHNNSIGHHNHSNSISPTGTASDITANSMAFMPHYSHRSIDHDIDLEFMTYTVSLYVNFRSLSQMTEITEENLYEIFGPYGATSVHIKSTNPDIDVPTHLRGYAFVHFTANDSGREKAINTVKILRDTVVNDIHINWYVCMSIYLMHISIFIIYIYIYIS